MLQVACYLAEAATMRYSEGVAHAILTDWEDFGITVSGG
jgi:hypothetical protein